MREEANTVSIIWWRNLTLCKRGEGHRTRYNINTHLLSPVAAGVTAQFKWGNSPPMLLNNFNSLTFSGKIDLWTFLYSISSLTRRSRFSCLLKQQAALEP